MECRQSHVRHGFSRNDGLDEDAEALNAAQHGGFLHVVRSLKEKPLWQQDAGFLMRLHQAQAHGCVEECTRGRKTVHSPLIGTMVEVFARGTRDVPGQFKRGVIESATDEVEQISGSNTKITTILCVQYSDGTRAKRVNTEDVMWRVVYAETDPEATETESEDSQATETESDEDK